jgi:molybdenum cofactor biosynthesis protein B
MNDPTATDAADAHLAAAPKRVAAAVLTVSDTRTLQTDASGDYLERSLVAAGHQVVARNLVRDEAEAIREAFAALFAAGAQVVLSTGGTGIAGRDVTVPVVEALLKKPLPGFGELFRMLSYREVGGAAMLSRAVGGLAEGGLIFALPGSKNAVQTAWEGLLRDQLGHLVYEVFRQGQGSAS